MSKQALLCYALLVLKQKKFKACNLVEFEVWRCYLICFLSDEEQRKIAKYYATHVDRESFHGMIPNHLETKELPVNISR